MSTLSLRQLGITCPYYGGPTHDEQHYLQTPIDTTNQMNTNNSNKVQYPLKRPTLPEIVDIERQDLTDFNYETIMMPPPS